MEEERKTDQGAVMAVQKSITRRVGRKQSAWECPVIGLFDITTYRRGRRSSGLSGEVTGVNRNENFTPTVVGGRVVLSGDIRELSFELFGIPERRGQSRWLRHAHHEFS